MPSTSWALSRCQLQAPWGRLRRAGMVLWSQVVLEAVVQVPSCMPGSEGEGTTEQTQGSHDSNKVSQ